MAASNDRVRTSLLAFLFTDIVGSTDLKRRLGDVEGAQAIAAHDASFRHCVAQYGGTEQNNPGDGFFATFPVPSAALSCALAFQAAISDQRVEARVGIHMGEAVLVPGAETSMKLLGLAVDTAGRVMSLAQPGQILVTRHAFDSARQQVLRGPNGGVIVWRSHGAYRFQGLEEAIEIHEAGIEGGRPLVRPPDSLKAQRVVLGATTPGGGRRSGPRLSRASALLALGVLLAALGMGGWLAGFWASGSAAPTDREVAREALARCDWAAAAEAFEALVTTGRAGGEDHLGLAEALIHIDGASAERAIAAAATALGTDDARVHLARARLAWQGESEDFEAALGHIGDALVADPTSVVPHALRVELLFAIEGVELKFELPRNWLALITADIDAIDERAPTDARVPYARGRLATSKAMRGDVSSMLTAVEVAVALFREAATRDPKWAEPLARAAVAYGDVAHEARKRARAADGDRPQEEALQLANASVARLDEYPNHRCQGTQRGWYLQRRAIVRMQAGDAEGALDDIRAAFGERKDVPARRMLASTLSDSGHLHEAILVYKDLTKATQDHRDWFGLGFCWQQTGVVQERLGEWDNARVAYGQSLKALDIAAAGPPPINDDLAYRGETHLLLAQLPGSDREAGVARAGRDFEAALGAALRETPKKHSTEIEHRRSLYLLAGGRVDEARRDLARAIEQLGQATPATHARYARVLLRCAARRATEAQPKDSALLLEQARERVAFVGRMKPSKRRSVGLAALQTEVALVGALLASDEALRNERLLSAAGYAVRTLELAATAPLWVHEGLALRHAMVRHLRGAPHAAAAALRAKLLADLAAGMMRPPPETYDLLADLCRARGDADGERRARARAKALRG